MFFNYLFFMFYFTNAQASICDQPTDVTESNAQNGKTVNCWECGKNCSARFDASTGQMTISGTGSMYAFSYPQPWNPNPNITSAIIENGITSVAQHAFAGLSSLQSVTIPNSVTLIGGSAFSGASSLTNLVIPDSVTTIMGHAFYGTSSLTSVTIPSSITSIGHYAFYGSNALEVIDLSKAGENLSIGGNAFNIANPNIKLICNTAQMSSTCSKSSLSAAKFNGTLYEFDGTDYKAKTLNENGVWQYTGEIVTYNPKGGFYKVIDNDGHVIAKYGRFSDIGTTNYYVRPKKLIYTPSEAIDTVNGSNKNTFILQYR